MSARTARSLSDRYIEILQALDGCRTSRGYRAGYSVAEWVRPLDIGGRDWSDHTRVLRRLVFLGFVETKQRHTRVGATGSGAWEKTKTTGAMGRGARAYRITRNGEQWLATLGKR